jgi:FtsZ-binding cell division protein ZapB
MFNLLPKERKKTIKKEYRLHFLALLLSMLTMTGIVTLVFLTPSFFTVRAKESRAEDQLRVLQQQTPELKEKKNLDSSVSEITRKIEVLEPQNTLLPSQAIQIVVDSRPKGILIKAVSYAISESVINITVTGRGDTRETLTTFTRNLRENETFNSVNLPVSNLAKDRDIDFSITLVVDLENV